MNLTFISRLKAFGFSKIIKSYDFILALILTIIGMFTFFNNILQLEIRELILSDIILASITIVTIVLAGFAIVISLTDKEFIMLLKKNDIYDNLLFNFEYTSMISLLTFLFSIFIKYIHYEKYLYFLTLFLFFYLIFSLFQLISYISTFGVLKGEIYK